jgi:hypothetical protein
LLNKDPAHRRSLVSPQSLNRQVKLLDAPVLFSYAAQESKIAETLVEGLDAAGLRIVLTPSSWHAARDDSSRRFESEVADGAAAHIILAGSEGLSPGLKAEFDNALRQCVLRPDFRLVPVLPAEVNPKVLPSYAARLQPIELLANLQHLSGVDLFYNLAAEISTRSPIIPVDETASPFLGFEHFEEGQARFFFGRDAEVIELTKQLGETPRTGEFTLCHQQ